jgi:ubiquinone/menaquinone biosynthesis C-methylase UbiE
MDNDYPPLARIIEEELLDFRIRSRFFHPAYVSTLGLTGTERVLEFGSGGGCLSRALAGVLSLDGSLSCVEISPYWIMKAQQRLKAYPFIEFLQGEITHLNLPENHFDAAIIHFVLHDIDPAERINVVNALARTLRPEGTLFIREPAKPSHGMPLAEIRSLMRDSGMREIRAGCTKSWQWKWICDGVFMKSW